jgi:hypothetical protein
MRGIPCAHRAARLLPSCACGMIAATAIAINYNQEQ